MHIWFLRAVTESDDVIAVIADLVGPDFVLLSITVTPPIHVITVLITAPTRAEGIQSELYSPETPTLDEAEMIATVEVELTPNDFVVNASNGLVADVQQHERYCYRDRFDDLINASQRQQDFNEQPV